MAVTMARPPSPSPMFSSPSPGGTGGALAQTARPASQASQRSPGGGGGARPLSRGGSAVMAGSGGGMAASWGGNGDGTFLTGGSRPSTGLSQHRNALSSSSSSPALIPAPNSGNPVLMCAAQLRFQANCVERRRFNDVEDVRTLSQAGKDKPHNEERAAEDGTRDPLDIMMGKLKSRQARMEAEQNRKFLVSYRSEILDRVTERKRDLELDKFIVVASERCEELKVGSEDLKHEVIHMQAQFDALVEQEKTIHTDEKEMQTLSTFERTHRRVLEDKQAEIVGEHKMTAQSNLGKAQRSLQNELAQLRDYKVLLRDYRRIRLDKLQVKLAGDHNDTRSCIRHMIRHGATRILLKLEAIGPPLEPWMREAIVNMAHLEIRIEDGQKKLLVLQKEALKPVNKASAKLQSQTEKERFEKLFVNSKEHPDSLQTRGGPRSWPQVHPTDGVETPRLPRDGKEIRWQQTSGVEEHCPLLYEAMPEATLAEMHAVEADMRALKTLLQDTRQNIAAVICNRMQQAEKSGTAEASKEWGTEVLSTLVSADFAKTVLKEVAKTAPTNQLQE